MYLSIFIYFLISLLIFLTDGISSVDQSGLVNTHRIKKLIMDLKQCVYMEASPVTGENVDHVFETGWLVCLVTGRFAR